MAKPSSWLRLSNTLTSSTAPKNICVFLIELPIFNCSNLIVFLCQLIWEIIHFV